MQGEEDPGAEDEKRRRIWIKLSAGGKVKSCGKWQCSARLKGLEEEEEETKGRTGR